MGGRKGAEWGAKRGQKGKDKKARADSGDHAHSRRRMHGKSGKGHYPDMHKQALPNVPNFNKPQRKCCLSDLRCLLRARHKIILKNVSGKAENHQELMEI